MERITWGGACGLLLGVVAAVSRPCAAAEAAAGQEFFESKIRPLLVDQCYRCHSVTAEKLKGDLLLDSRDGVLKGGANGPVVVPGDPDKSRLIEAVRRTNKELQMPPKQTLTPAQVEDLVKWVKMGAPDPRKDAPKPPNAIDYAAARKTWAFGHPREHPVPAVKDAAWCKSPIDHFILEKLEARGLKPAPPADKRTLIRRAYFDLIGLPPKPEDVEAFVADNSPDAFAKVVDSLLASPHYGERWARHWLDVVRYTDSFDQRGIGSEGDCVFAWRYRDWVVRAFNEDMPYDRFVTNQIAGDLLPAEKPGEFNADGLVATTMYVIGNWPGGDADRRKMMTDMADDQVDVTGRAFLGVTLACARCHDHKFDPVAQKDYYGLAGIFLSTHFLPNPGSPASGVGLLRVPMASAAEVERRKQYDARLTDLQKQLDGFVDAQYVAAARTAIPDTDRYMTAAWEFSRAKTRVGAESSSVEQFATGRKLDPYLLTRWVDYLSPMWSAEPTRRVLTRAIRTAGGVAGVDGWSGADGRPCPNVLANNTGSPVTITTLTLPPHTLAMHPGPSTGVAVGWTSPIDGKVQVAGKVTDADPSCGNGIAWTIEHDRDHASETLASGAFENSGSQSFADGEGGDRIKTIVVHAGDVIQLTVWPKGDYSCDTTLIDLQVSEIDGQKRTWDVVRDVLPDVLAGDKGNPHADSTGRPGVWTFFEAGEESVARPTLTPGSSLQSWVAEASHSTDADRVLARAGEVRDALVKLDAAADRSAKPTNPESKLYADLTSPTGPFWGAARKELSHLSPDITRAVGQMADGLAALKKNAPPPVEMALGLLEGGIPQSEYEGTHDTHVLARGRYDRPLAVAPRGFPGLFCDDADQPHITRGSGRLELARWIASPNNPMTAKVMANRIWEHHFGQGIVRTPSNYGKLGVPPTHPELLDWLALRFVEKGWSMKAMHRMIMLSATYQQASTADEAATKVDPDNLLFGRMNRQRLEAEPLRDALLAVSGKLDETPGGPAFRDLNVPRRTLYLMTIRSDRSNYRMLFDAADPTAIIDHRIDSTVAPQALFLLNNPFAIQRSADLAARALARPGDDRARLEWLYRLLYCRPATEEEVQIGLSELQKAKEAKAADGKPTTTDAAWQEYCQVLLCANEFVYID